jgi:hypothetical protein
VHRPCRSRCPRLSIEPVRNFVPEQHRFAADVGESPRRSLVICGASPRATRQRSVSDACTERPALEPDMTGWRCERPVCLRLSIMGVWVRTRTKLHVFLGCGA